MGWDWIYVKDANNVLGSAGNWEDSTEYEASEEPKQNKASRPILTFAPLPQQRAAPPHSPRFQRKKKPATGSASLNRAGGSSFPPLSLSNGALGPDCGCLQLPAAGTSPGPRHQLQRLCAVSSAASLLCTWPGENVTIAILSLIQLLFFYFSSILIFVLLTSCSTTHNQSVFKCFFFLSSIFSSSQWRKMWWKSIINPIIKSNY